MILFLCMGLAAVVSTFVLWRTPKCSGAGRTLLCMAVYYGSGVAGYAIERLFSSAAPEQVNAHYLRLVDSALMAVVVLALVQETIVGILFDLHRKWRGGIPNEEPNTKASGPEIGGKP